MSFEYWFMFPVAILVATTAMASGVGGATFFAPIFILALRLPPEVAIGTGLITEVFGFASGVGAYVRKRLIDYRLGVALLVATIPAAIVGSWLSGALYVEAMSAFRSAGSEQAAENNLAYIYFMNGLLDDAIAHYELALQAQGDDRLKILRNLNAALDAKSASNGAPRRNSARTRRAPPCGRRVPGTSSPRNRTV